MIFTDAGIAAIAGGAGIVVDKIKFGSSGYVASASQRSLRTQIISLTPASTSVSGERLIIEAVIDGDEQFSVREFGLFLEDGTMIAVYSDPRKTLAEKTIGSTVEIVLIIAINADAAAQISFSTAAFGAAALHDHIARRDNPHELTVEDIGGVGDVAINALISNAVIAERVNGITEARVIELIEARASQNFYVNVFANGVTRSASTAKRWARVLLRDTDTNDIIIVKWNYQYEVGTGNGAYLTAAARYELFIDVGTDWLAVGNYYVR